MKGTQRPVISLFLTALALVPPAAVSAATQEVPTYRPSSPSPPAKRAPDTQPPNNGSGRGPQIHSSQRDKPREDITASPAITAAKQADVVSQSQHASSFGTVLALAKEYAQLAAAIGTLSASVIALYLGVWKTWFQRPKLRLRFSEKRATPYFRRLAFDRYPKRIDFVGQDRFLVRPGFNARVKVCNEGKTTAKGVRARVEKIQLGDGQPISEEVLYHPTTVKWSGEREWDAVDISPDSHFFLDVLWSKSERVADVLAFNSARYPDMDAAILRQIIEDDVRPSGEVYWNVWVDVSYDRGIPPRYGFQGDVTIYFIVDATNAAPLRFEALIHWTPDTYNAPTIRIRQDTTFIDND